MIKDILRLFLFTIMATTLSGCGYSELHTLEDDTKKNWQKVNAAHIEQIHIVEAVFALSDTDTTINRTHLDSLNWLKVKAIAASLANSSVSEVSLQGVSANQHLVRQALQHLFDEAAYSGPVDDPMWADIEQRFEQNKIHINTAQINYNRSVRAYNTFLRKFPALLYAHSIGCSDQPYLHYTTAVGNVNVREVENDEE